MPKKTKKEKILAVRHRQQGMISSIPQSVDTHSALPPQVKNIPSYVFQSKHSDTIATASMDLSERDYIRKDLVRTLVLSLLAIGVEVVLYLRLGR